MPTLDPPHSLAPSKRPTIQQPEVIVGQTNEQHTEQQQQEKGKISVAGEKKMLLVQSFARDQASAIRRSVLEWVATTENVFRLPKQKAVKTVWKCEIRVEARRGEQEIVLVPWTKKKEKEKKEMIVWYGKVELRCGEALEWTDDDFFLFLPRYRTLSETGNENNVKRGRERLCSSGETCRGCGPMSFRSYVMAKW